jgi:hypothetical protein
MPNWVYNSLTISHPDKTKVDELEFAIQQKIGEDGASPFFNYLRPNPHNDSSSDWYDWAIENWGVRRYAFNVEYFGRADNTLEIYFDTAWCSPIQLFNYIAEKGWIFKNIYDEESDAFMGIHTERGDSYIEPPAGRRNLRRLLDNLEDEDDNGGELYDAFSGNIIAMIERLDEQAEDDDYESEDDEPEDEDEEEVEKKLPITEASRIILSETKNRIEESPEKNFYIRKWLINKWDEYVKINSDLYDEKFFAIITTKAINKTINWSWIVEELNKPPKKTRKLRV